MTNMYQLYRGITNGELDDAINAHTVDGVLEYYIERAGNTFPALFF
jgi:hypothetical protein